MFFQLCSSCAVDAVAVVAVVAVAVVLVAVAVVVVPCLFSLQLQRQSKSLLLRKSFNS